LPKAVRRACLDLPESGRASEASFTLNKLSDEAPY